MLVKAISFLSYYGCLHRYITVSLEIVKIRPLVSLNYYLIYILAFSNISNSKDPAKLLNGLIFDILGMSLKLGQFHEINLSRTFMTIHEYLQKTFCSFIFLLFRWTVIAISGGQSTTVDWPLLAPTGDLSCSRLHICAKRMLEFCLCRKTKGEDKNWEQFPVLGYF